MSSLTVLLVQCSICMELSGGSIRSIHDKLSTEFLTPHIVLMNNLHLLLAKTLQNVCCEGESPVFLPSQYLPYLRSVSRRKTLSCTREMAYLFASVQRKSSRQDVFPTNLRFALRLQYFDHVFMKCWVLFVQILHLRYSEQPSLLKNTQSTIL